jgi:hypothetical protein
VQADAHDWLVLLVAAPTLDRAEWVNDIMQLDHGPRSSLDENMLATSLKALTVDQFLAELMVSPAACKPICVNQAARTVLLAMMPTLDDVDIAAM